MAAATDKDTLTFHPKCGPSVYLLPGGTSVQRRSDSKSWSSGIVLTSRSLRPEEMFEVKIETLSKWASFIKLGLCTHDPAIIDLPGTMLEITSGTWYMSGTDVLHNGKILTGKYGNSLSRLKQGDRIGARRKSDGTLHFYHNGTDLGVAATDVPENLYGILDLFGRGVLKASIIDRSDPETLAKEIPFEAVSLDAEPEPVNTQEEPGEAEQGNPEDAEIVVLDNLYTCTRAFYNKVKSKSYDMIGKDKGRVLIINMTENRDGCEEDRRTMKQLFKDLGYRVQILEDPDLSAMEAVVKSFACSTNNEEAKSIFVVLMAHGGMTRRQDLFVTLADGERYFFMTQFKQIFNNQNAPLLVNKPKVFIIQTCMGGLLDEGILSRNFGTPPPETQTDFSASLDRLTLIPTTTDCLFAFSTMPYYQASRNRFDGSIFLNEIDIVFRQETHVSHVCEMLTMVRQNVEEKTGAEATKILEKKRKEKKTTDDNQEEDDIFVQTTHNIDFLKKRFYIFPGI